MRIRCAAGCTGSTPLASTGSVTGPARDASGGSPRRSGRTSSRWPARRRRGSWPVMRPGNCPPTMSAAQRNGPWTPSPRRPGTPASPWDAARSGGFSWLRRCAGGGPAAGRRALIRCSPQKPGHPGGGRIRERIRGAARWTAGVSWFVVLRLPGLAGCGMMARAARDAGVSLGYEPVQKPGAGTLTRRVASCCLEHAGQTSRSRTDLGPRAAR